MIVVHHLNDSRSQRILWLLEELGLPYEIKRYQRDAKTRLAPPELKAVSPLGKSPVITDGDRRVIESGAIIDYLIRRHGGGRLQPDPASEAYDEYVQWLHYAEGSAMLPLMLHLYVSRLGEAGAPLVPRIESELANHLGYIDASLQGRGYLVGDGLTGADIQMSFVAELAGMFGRRAAYPNVEAWISACMGGLPTKQRWSVAAPTAWLDDADALLIRPAPLRPAFDMGGPLRGRAWATRGPGDRGRRARWTMSAGGLSPPSLGPGTP